MADHYLRGLRFAASYEAATGHSPPSLNGILMTARSVIDSIAESYFTRSIEVISWWVLTIWTIFITINPGLFDVFGSGVHPTIVFLIAAIGWTACALEGGGLLRRYRKLPGHRTPRWAACLGMFLYFSGLSGALIWSAPLMPFGWTLAGFALASLCAWIRLDVVKSLDPHEHTIR